MYVILWPKGELFLNERGNLFHICGRIHEKKYGVYSFIQFVTCSVSVKWTHTVLFFIIIIMIIFRLFTYYVALQGTLHIEEFVKKCMDLLFKVSQCMIY